MSNYPEIVEDVVSSSCSIEQAVEKFTALFVGADSPPGEAWGAVLLAARKGNPTTQQKLTAFLAALLQELQSPQHEQDRFRLPGLGLEMREIWNEMPPATNSEEWARINSFAARCTAAEIDDFSLFAIWTFREALEIKRPLTAGSDSGMAIDTLLPAVNAWMEQCGLVLARYAMQGRQFATESNDPAKGGQLLRDSGTAKGGYSPERWNFWKTRLQEIAGGSSDTSVQQCANQTLERMQSVEERTSLRS